MNPLLMILSLGVIIFSAILHEIAHGLVADRLGDPTARLRGRLTLNPVPHIDLWMSIVIPLLLILGGSPIIIGGAKPVPVDPFNLRDGKKDLAIVSLAGPVTNFLIAGLSALLAHILFPEASLFALMNTNFLGLLLGLFINYNLMLGIFNLIPIPPLDGSKILAMFLPPDIESTYLSMSAFGFFIIFFLLMPFSPVPLGSIISNMINVFLHLLAF